MSSPFRLLHKDCISRAANIHVWINAMDLTALYNVSINIKKNVISELLDMVFQRPFTPFYSVECRSADFHDMYARCLLPNRCEAKTAQPPLERNTPDLFWYEDIRNMDQIVNIRIPL